MQLHRCSLKMAPAPLTDPLTDAWERLRWNSRLVRLRLLRCRSDMWSRNRRAPKRPLSPSDYCVRSSAPRLRSVRWRRCGGPSGLSIFVFVLTNVTLFFLLDVSEETPMSHCGKGETGRERFCSKPEPKGVRSVWPHRPPKF